MYFIRLRFIALFAAVYRLVVRQQKRSRSFFFFLYFNGFYCFLQHGHKINYNSNITTPSNKIHVPLYLYIYKHLHNYNTNSNTLT